MGAVKGREGSSHEHKGERTSGSSDCVPLCVRMVSSVLMISKRPCVACLCFEWHRGNCCVFFFLGGGGLELNINRFNFADSMFSFTNCAAEDRPGCRTITLTISCASNSSDLENACEVLQTHESLRLVSYLITGEIVEESVSIG